MDKLVNVLLAIDSAHSTTEGSGVGGLNQVYLSHSICLEYLYQMYK